MSDGFDASAFDEDLDKIETYLGYLQGNHLMWQYFHDYNLSTVGEVPWPVEFNYTSPCPDGRFKVRFDHYPSIDVIIGEGESDLQQQRLQEIKDNLDQSWHNGQAWAGGVAAQMRQVCAQFTEPYVPTMVSAIEDLQAQVVMRLDISANDDWLSLGGAETDWDGNFAYNFRVFYENYNDVLSRFGVFTGQIALGFSLAARIIAGVQCGAGKFVASLRKNLESQLDHWADQGGDKPSEPSEWPAWVGNVKSLVESTMALAGDVPIVGKAAKVKGYVDKTTAVLEDVDALVGGGLLPEKQTYEKVMTAEEAFELLSSTLYDDHYQAYVDGMDQLNAGGAGDGYQANAFSGHGLVKNMRDVKDADDWSLPNVPASNLN